ncbi:hypothetical protein [Motiliproteus sp. SC1-56]|uniref:hypothetical protein n=1 Tax=Motiliproteus sp. SC1-56 TaxID=2799565 RepID=UPI001A8CCAB7|nr:hypothetical protein [Motiliproteus sp. SC1-56]
MSQTTQRTAPRWLGQLAAAHWTVLFFLATALSALAVTRTEGMATVLMVVPFTLLALNLGAAIITLPRFRRDLPLLIFHLSLLALVILLVASRLTYFQAGANLAEGETFSGNWVASEGGPMHHQAARELSFTNLGFRDVWPRQGPFRYTYNRIQWQSADGQSHFSVIGNDTPLVLNGYRIYTGPVRGFAPVFRWEDNKGNRTVGMVHLNNEVVDETPSVNEWQLPSGTRVWAMLDRGAASPREFAPRADRRERRNLGADSLPHSLVLRLGDAKRFELRVGESVDIDNGTLTYLKLTAWMGYKIIYDPMRPWLLSTVIIGVLSLCWFYLRRVFRGSSWDSD